MQGYKAINITCASRVRLNYTLTPYTSIRAVRAVRTQYLCCNISLRIISLGDIDKPGYGAKNITEYYSEHWITRSTTANSLRGRISIKDVVQYSETRSY